jgi:hypothetical protein
MAFTDVQWERIRHTQSVNKEKGNKSMTTGKKPAKEAGKELGSKKSTAGQKTVAASDLSQAKKAPPKKKK